MMTVFFKELRENLKWAAVICGVLLMFVVHEIRDTGPGFLFDFPNKHTLFIAPLAGLLLGVVQMLFETKPDNWGFVVHRPVSRRKIFIAKCAAGLLLLYVSLLLPCIVAWTWAARAGNLAIPFQARMTLPMLGDVLNGGCYYFVGMLLTLRRARWLGSRLLPLGLALASSAAITILVQAFWQVLLIIGVVQAIGATAAWGIFAASGENPPAIASRIALGVMIYPGALGVIIALIGFTEAFSVGMRWQYYQIDRAGNVVLVTQTIERGERGWSFTDPAGNPLPQYGGLDLDDPANASQFVKFSTHLIDPRTIPWPLTVQFAAMGYRSPTPGIVALRSAAPSGAKLPFAALYDAPQRIIDLYDPVSHAQIGTVGPAGFAPAHVEPAQRFSEHPINLFLQGGTHTLTFASQVYWLRLDQRRVQPIFTALAGDPIFAAGEVGPNTNPLAIVATCKSLHLLRPDGTLIFSAAMPLDPARYYFDAALLPNDHLVLQAYPIPGGAREGRHIMEFSPTGALVRTAQPPLLTDPRSPKKYETMMFGAVYPLAARPLLASWILDDLIDIRSEDFPRLFEGFMWASAILCAGFALLIGRRCGLGMGRTIGWSLASLLLGPAAVAVMLSINDWAARETCAACGRKRLAARHECIACGAAHPAAALDGREIFEPADALPPPHLLQSMAH
jgi:hypothetical protein